MFLGQKGKSHYPRWPLARGEGTNSALAKCKVNQISWAHGYDPRVDLLTDLKNMAVCQEWDNRISTLSPQNTTQKSISIAFCVSSIRHDSSLSKYRKQKQSPPWTCAILSISRGGLLLLTVLAE